MTNLNSDSNSESLPSTLYRQALQQDEQAWAKLLHIFGPLIEDWLRKLHIPQHDVDDLKQNVFRTMFRALPTFKRTESSSTFRGWLWTVTRNQVRDHWRRAAKQAQAEGGSTAQHQFAELPEELSDDSCAPPAGDSGGILRRGLELIRAEFNEKTWAAFWKCTVEELATDDVAVQLDMTVGHVYVAKSRVLKRLREELGEMLD